jgi:DNA-binding NarL/FixJ family response regulator
VTTAQAGLVAPPSRLGPRRAADGGPAGLSLVSGTTIPLLRASPASTFHDVVIVPRPTVLAQSGADPVIGPRVVVVDGQSLFVQALAGLLARPPLHARPRTSARSDEALELLAAEPADLALCDLRVQPSGLRGFLAALRGLPAPPAVIVLADAEDEQALVAEMDTGVAGLFTKDSEPEQFLEGVRAVLAGHRAVGDNVMRRVLARLNGTEAAPPRPGLDQLSPTELDILAMVGAASSVEQIAQARGISQKTVRNHLANIYRKLDLRSRTEAMLCAARMGLTSADPVRAPRPDPGQMSLPGGHDPFSLQ